MARHQNKARHAKVKSWVRAREPAAPASGSLSVFFMVYKPAVQKIVKRTLQPRRVTEMRDARRFPNCQALAEAWKERLVSTCVIRNTSTYDRFIFTTRRVLDVNYEFYGTK